MMGLLIPLVLVLLSFTTSLIATKYVMKSAKAKGFLGKDMHKPKKPLIPEMGGLGFSLGFVISAFVIEAIIVIVYIPEFYQLLPLLYVSSFVIAIATLLGLMSDIFKFRWRTNTILPSLSAIPLLGLATQSNMTTIYTPFGDIQLGPIGYLIALFLGATGSANAVNMIAGYNGLEAGMTSIIVIGLGVIALLSGNYPVFLLAMLILGSLLGFLYWNRYPARVFPGDVGTWSFGAGIFLLAVFGKLEFWATLMFALYFVNLGLFLMNKNVRKKIEKFTTVLRDGRLTAKTDVSIYHWIAKRFHPTEDKMIKILLSLQAIITASVICMFIFIKG